MVRQRTPWTLKEKVLRPKLDYVHDDDENNITIEIRIIKQRCDWQRLIITVIIIIRIGVTIKIKEQYSHGHAGCLRRRRKTRTDRHRHGQAHEMFFTHVTVWEHVKCNTGDWSMHSCSNSSQVASYERVKNVLELSHLQPNLFRVILQHKGFQIHKE
jgi:hypothetical protein